MRCRAYCAPHSKRSRFSVRVEKRWPFGQVIVTCVSPCFPAVIWLSPWPRVGSGICAAIAPHSGQLTPQYHSPTMTCCCSVAIRLSLWLHSPEDLRLTSFLPPASALFTFVRVVFPSSPDRHVAVDQHSGLHNAVHVRRGREI